VLLSTIFSVILFFSGVISNVVLFCKLGTLSFFNANVYIALPFSELLCSLGTMPLLLPHAYKFKYFFSSRNSKVGGPFVIPTNDKTFSSHGLTLPSPPLFSSCNFDPSNAYHIEDVLMPLNGSSLVLKMIRPSNPRWASRRTMMQ
jgi:hypothetical protein